MRTSLVPMRRTPAPVPRGEDLPTADSGLLYDGLSRAQMEYAERVFRSPALSRAIAWRTARCWIYVIDDGEYIKVGSTLYPEHRIRSIQGVHARELTARALFPGSRETEGWIHMTFAPHRIRGEWYHQVPPVTAWVGEMEVRYRRAVRRWERARSVIERINGRPDFYSLPGTILRLAETGLGRR